VTADHAACPFKLATDLAINGVGWRLEREDFQDPEHGLKLSRQPGRALFRRPKPKFRRDNDAGADTGLANLADALGDATARIPDEVRNDVCIEEIPCQSATGSGTGSSTDGKSSSSGVRVASNANKDFGAVGSIISRPPSFRMIASSP